MTQDWRSRSPGLRKAAAEIPAALPRPSGDAERNVLSVQQQLEAIAQGDVERTLAQASPDVTFELFAPPEFPFIRRATGIEALRAALEHNFAAVTEQQPTITNVIAQGDVVVLIGSERGRIEATGASYHVEFVHRFTFEGSTLTSLRIIAARVA